MVCLIWLISMGTTQVEKGAMLSRSACMQRSNLLDDQLRILDATKFVDVEPVGKLYNTPVGRPGLVKRDGVDYVATTSRSHAHLEMLFANGALLYHLKIAAPQRLGKARTPGAGIAQ